MLIPKSFELFAQTITVEYRRTLHRSHKAVGLWIPGKNKILLQQRTKTYEITDEQIEQTFLHELTHALLTILGYESLSHDEKLVDLIGNGLHQIIKSVKY